MRVLVVNAGSSSLKLRLLGPDDELLGTRDLARRRCVKLRLRPDDELLGTRDLPADAPGLVAAIEELGPADAVGHRVVHGADRFAGPTILDDEVVCAYLRTRSAIWRHYISRRRSRESWRCAGLLPDVAQVACFDTAFPYRRSRPRRPLRGARRSGRSAGGCAGTASMGSRTRMRLAARRAGSTGGSRMT